MRFAWVLLFIAALTGTGCSRCSPPPPVEGERSDPRPVPPPEARAAPKAVRDPRLLQMVKLSVQADQILREAWWVLAGEKLPAPRSVFGKVQRAALLRLDGRLATKNVFRCDRYEMKITEKPSWSATLAETCVKNSPREFAVWTLESPTSARVEFSPQHLEEVLGLGTSVYGRRLTCRLRWSGEAVLDHLSCPQWEQDRRHQLLRLEVFEYKREGQALLRLRGRILENLQPVKKIEADVPLEGKIVVTETELAPPIAVPAAPVKTATPNPPPKALDGGVAGHRGQAAPAAKSVRRGAPAQGRPGARNADLPARGESPAPGQSPSPALVPVLDPTTGQMIFVPPGMIPADAMPTDMIPVPMNGVPGWPGDEPPEATPPLAEPEFIEEGGVRPLPPEPPPEAPPGGR
ncbi:MAG: hypothetical protein KF802_00380 [Bdellovibrionaceae bacterium]|nr:hypothetical protein [Pseudobdellovibrionaceae bacterium]MBX3034720.1 hypothetical protein [Pseudobdellovibrionaceae bacterium]